MYPKRGHLRGIPSTWACLIQIYRWLGLLCGEMDNLTPAQLICNNECSLALRRHIQHSPMPAIGAVSFATIPNIALVEQRPGRPPNVTLRSFPKPISIMRAGIRRSTLVHIVPTSLHGRISSSTPLPFR